MVLNINSSVGNWKIISEKYKKNNIFWNDCECICGIIRPVRTWWLNTHKTKGCGCTNIKGRFKSSSIGDLSLSYYTSFKQSRIRKNIFFSEDVTQNYLWTLFLEQKQKCAISGIKLQLNPKWSQQNKGKETEIIQNASIDRINSNIGYIIGNIQWVHKDINLMKGSLKEQDFISYCKQVYINNQHIPTNENFNNKLKWYGK